MWMWLIVNPSQLRVDGLCTWFFPESSLLQKDSFCVAVLRSFLLFCEMYPISNTIVRYFNDDHRTNRSNLNINELNGEESCCLHASLVEMLASFVKSYKVRWDDDSPNWWCHLKQNLKTRFLYLPRWPAKSKRGNKKYLVLKWQFCVTYYCTLLYLIQLKMVILKNCSECIPFEKLLHKTYTW